LNLLDNFKMSLICLGGKSKEVVAILQPKIYNHL
jgi:hypothetical protein